MADTFTANPTDLQGRVALISGAGRGLGAAAAQALASAGAAVMVADISMDEAEAVATSIASKGQKARAILLDVTDEASWQHAVTATVAAFGGIDILVNNAGLFFLSPVEATSLAEWRRMMAVNVEGVFLGTKTCLPILKERGPKWPGGASIINLSSISGLVGSPFATTYNASKGAVRLYTKGTALEFAQLGYRVRVNSIHPGVIETRMGQQVIDDFSAISQIGANETRTNMIARHPLGRLGLPKDISDAVLFLAGDMSAFMTGSEVVVDGGLTAS
jgi:NAD(P)-dependent dehydrogenase (short-subunit alcohol dehydrogenase family)